MRARMRGTVAPVCHKIVDENQPVLWTLFGNGAKCPSRF
jgi:hypothetical protein